MTRASAAMASGNFSVRADESRDDEIGLLGVALNHLSTQLQRNISDLVLARNRLHVILDGLHEGVVALEADNTVIYQNQAACQLLGACTDETLMRSSCARAAALRRGSQERGSAIAYDGLRRKEAAARRIAVAGDERTCAGHGHRCAGCDRSGTAGTDAAGLCRKRQPRAAHADFLDPEPCGSAKRRTGEKRR